MKKQVVGYCDTCHRETKHNVIECEDSLGERILENIITFGLVNAVSCRRYKCECARCGEINTIYK